MSKFPPPVEAAIFSYQEELGNFKKLNRLIDCYECLMKFMTIVAIQDFYQNPEIVRENPKTDLHIRNALT